jgi:uncharacterized protein with HEPN domain
MSRSTKLRLEDMLRAARRIVVIVAERGIEALPDDEDMQDIVVRQLSIIGESSAALRKQLEPQYPAVDWKGIRGLRNYLVHGYFDLHWAKIGRALELLPELIKQLELIAADVPDDAHA